MSRIGRKGQRERMERIARKEGKDYEDSEEGRKGWRGLSMMQNYLLNGEQGRSVATLLNCSPSSLS